MQYLNLFISEAAKLQKFHSKWQGTLAFLLFISWTAHAQSPETFNASGSWVCPAGVTSATVEAWGAGGGGGGATGTTGAKAGGGGGSGGYSSATLTVVPGTTYTVTVGAVGNGWTAALGASSAGGASSFGTTLVVANGGGAGGTAVNSGSLGTAGAGATAGTGSTSALAGNAGGAGTSTLSGAGGNAPGTGGGAGGAAQAGTAVTGTAPGGGGSGGRITTATNRNGGNGGLGRVVVTYTSSCPATALPLTQGFNSTSAPTCWYSNQSVANTLVSYVTSSSIPTISAASEGSNFVKYNSALRTQNERLVSTPLITTSTSSTLTFDWYESSSLSSATEGVTIEYTTNGGTSFTSTGSSFLRYNAGASAGGSWVSKTVSMPAGFLSQANVSVVFNFTGNSVGNSYLDNVRLQANCLAPSNQSANLTFSNIGTGQVTGTFPAATSTPSGYLVVRYNNGASVTNPSNGTTYTAGNALGTGTVISAGTALTFTNTGLTSGNTYTYYVYAYNNTSCYNIAYNTTSPTSNSVTVASCPTFASTITINPSATVVAGSVYNTLTDVLALMSGCTVTGPTVIELASNYTGSGETFPLLLGAFPGMSASNTITIRPATGASNLTLSSATIAQGIFNVDGGKYWIIDGRSGGTGTTRNLTIENTDLTLAGSCAVRFFNGGQNNIVRFCNLKSANIGVSSGVVSFNTSTDANLGNSFNTITNNNISSSSAGLSGVGIGSAPGSTGTICTNSGNIITNNNIFDIFSAAGNTYYIYLSNNNTDWTITGNSFYSTSSRVFTGTSNTRNFCMLGVSPASTLASSTYGINFSNNFLGGSSAQCGGSALTITDGNTGGLIFTPIFLEYLGTITATSIQGNTIQNFNVTNSNTSVTQSLIFAANGNINIGNITGNILGSQSTTGSVSFTSISATTTRFNGIYAGANTPGIINISNNTIGGITVSNSNTGNAASSGIHLINASSTYTVSNNTIGSTSTANSFVNNTTGNFYGIICSSVTLLNNITNNTIANLRSSAGQIMGIRTDGGVNTITGNTVRNMNTTSTSATGIMGIFQNTTALNGHTVSGNTVHSLSNSDASGSTNAVYGINYNGPTTGTNLIERNFVHSLALSTSSNAGIITGINVAAGTLSVQNNMVRVGINAAGSSLTTGYAITGINNGSSSTVTYYFNSVYVGGSSVSGTTSNTFGLASAGTVNNRTFQNNILVNARTGGSTGKHYGISLLGSGANPTGLTSNYNLIQGAIFGSYAGADVANLTSWNTATGQDVNTASCDPSYVLPTGTSSTVDLHISGTSPIEGAGTVIAGISTDIDGNDRSTNTPTDIGADAGNFTSAAVLASGATVVCTGGSTVLSSSSATNNVWSTGATTQNITINSAGNYSVRTISGSCTSALSNVIAVSTSSNCTNTWTGTGLFTSTGNWSLGFVPASAINTVVSTGNATLSGDASVKNLTISSGATITINSGDTLFVFGNLVNSGSILGTGFVKFKGSSAQTFTGSSSISNLALQNTSGLTLISSVTISGTLVLETGTLTSNGNLTMTATSSSNPVVVNKSGSVAGTAAFEAYITGSFTSSRAARHVSSPVSNATVSGLTSGDGGAIVERWNETAYNGTVGSAWQSVSGGTSMTVGTGYSYRALGNRTLSLSGTLNNGTIPLTLTRTNNNGWNLIGNPYPSALDWDKVIADGSFPGTSNMSTAKFRYVSLSATAGIWYPYINGFPSGGNEIPAMSSVLIRSYTASTVLTLKNSHRYTSATSGTISRVASVDTRTAMYLDLVNPTSNLSDQAIVYFQDGASLAFNGGFDAVKLGHNVANMPTVSSAVLNSSCAIKGLPLLANDGDVQIVPVKTTLPSTGTFRFNAAQLLNFDNVSVYLIDSITNTITDLKAAPSYSFAGNQGSTSGRFSLRFVRSNSVTSIAAKEATFISNAWPNPNNSGMLTINYSNAKIQSVATCEMLNSLGQVVVSEQMTIQDSGIITLKTSHLAKGIYHLKIQAGTIVTTQKIVID